MEKYGRTGLGENAPDERDVPDTPGPSDPEPSNDDAPMPHGGEDE